MSPKAGIVFVLWLVAGPPGVLGYCPVGTRETGTPRVVSSTGGGVINVGVAEYQPNMDCTWLITSQPRDCPSNNPILRISWSRVNTEKPKDYVTVYDGDSKAYRELVQVTGTDIPPAINSSGASVLVAFHTDEDDEGATLTGFQLIFNYTCSPDPKPLNVHCRPISMPLLLTDSQGVLDFTDEANTLQECVWVISNELSNCTNARLELDFTDFSAEFPYDWLEIYDGNMKIPSKRLGRFQGVKDYDGPGFQKSIGRQVMLIFHNEAEHQWEGGDTGFRVEYESVCNQPVTDSCPDPANPVIFNGKKGFFYFGAESYDSSENCWFLFQNTNASCKSKTVLLRFPSFRTEALYDTVTVYDGPNPASVKLGEWSGYRPDAVPLGFTRTSGDTALVVFRSSSDAIMDDPLRGFTIQYDFPCAEDLPPLQQSCAPYLEQNVTAKVLGVEPTVINFTAVSYRNNLDCGWIFVNNQRCPNGAAIVQLEFSMFHTESNYDFLNIYEGNDWEETFLIASYSGTKGWEVPINATRSVGNTMMVTFHSDGDVSAQDNHDDGFVMKVSALCSLAPLPKPSLDCRGDYGDVYMSVTTPFTVPKFRYGHHYIPFNLGYPIVIEQYFTNPTNISKLSSWGTRFPDTELAFAVDAVHGNDTSQTTLCCGDFDQTKRFSALTGKVVVCDRGECLFVQKIRNAQLAGAAAVIVVDSGEDGVRMGSLVPVDDITIPSVSIRQSVGQFLRNVSAYSPQGTGVHIKLSAFQCYAGTFAPTSQTRRPSFRPTPPPIQPTQGVSPTAVQPTVAAGPTALVPTMMPVNIPPSGVNLYFTVGIKSTSFNSEETAKFTATAYAFFDWPYQSATIVSTIPDPNDADRTIVTMRMPESVSQGTLRKWGTSTTMEQSQVVPPLLLVSAREPHPLQRCQIECISTRYMNAEEVNCSCEHSLTSFGVFVYILIPLWVVGVIISVVICFCVPSCPLAKKQRTKPYRENIPMDDVPMMNPRRVTSEESMNVREHAKNTDDDPDEHVTIKYRRDSDADPEATISQPGREHAEDVPPPIPAPTGDESDEEGKATKARKE